jgi:hypothetical protein
MDCIAEQLLSVLDTQHPLLDLERRIEAAERHYQRWSKGMLHKGDGKVHITEAMDLLHWIKHMEIVTKRIAKGEEVAVKLDPLISGRVAHYALTPVGKAIVELYKEAVPLMEMLYPDCRRIKRSSSENKQRQKKTAASLMLLNSQFNAHITVMLLACQSLRGKLLHYGYSTLDLDQVSVRKAIERTVNVVRRVCRSEPFKAVHKKQRHNEQQNLKRFCEYMAKAFATCSKLLVMRVDLYYPSDGGGWCNKIEAEKCLERFLRAVSQGRIVPDVKARIVKHENAPCRGIHFHLLVALDGHKHCAASHYSQMLCKAWDGHYTDGLGTSFNCYTRRHEHEFNGLGLVHVSDCKKLMGLRAAINYMVKAETSMQTGSPRNITRGTIKLVCGEAKRGAPRKDIHDMSLVKALLGRAKLPSS